MGIRALSQSSSLAGLIEAYGPANFFIASALTIVIVAWVVNSIRRRIALRKLAKAEGCEPVQRWPLKDTFFGMDYWKQLNAAAKEQRLLNWLREQYDKYGDTYYTRLHITDVITTCNPDNLKAMHTTKYADFAVDKRRELAFLPLLGQHSILLANGPVWEHKRAMLRPSFSRDQYTNTPLFEIHVGHLIDNIKRSGGKTDLAPLFLRLTVDFTSHIMFGRSIELLVSEEENLIDNMTTSAESGHAAWLLVWLSKIIRQPVYHDAVAKVRHFMKRYVEDAVAFRKTCGNGAAKKPADSTTKLSADRAIYLEEVARQTSDPKVMLDELTTILFAGRDTTAALLTNLFYLLARRPEIWAKLREQVAFLRGEKPTHEQLKTITYLQSCLNEALRLHPVIPINTRMATADTVLPRGGGKDGKSPIVVPKGTNIAFHVTALHRRKDLWGEDAEEYRPERWTSLQAGWKYQPFGLGPRNCPGQHLSLAEAAYTLCRLAQEFETIEATDDSIWKELISLTCTSAAGANVKMVEAPKIVSF